MKQAIYKVPILHFRTRTPKGDGNRKALQRTALGASRFQNTNPERGRKQELSRTIRCRLFQFQNTNPERGRKLPRLLAVGRLLFWISEHEPRKGTETFASSTVNSFFILHFRTRTPKGDGNATTSTTTKYSPRSFQNTNPERGRKLLHIGSRLPKDLDEFQNTNPERGRKLV